MNNIYTTTYLRSILVRFSLIVATTSCAHSKPVLVIVDPEITAGTSAVQELSLASVSILCPWQARNPNNIAVNVNRASWKLIIDGEPEQAGSSEINKAIQPNDTLNDAITITSPLLTTVDAFKSREGKTALRYSALANINVTNNGQADDYEIEWHGDLFAPQVPAVRITSQASRFDRGVEIRFVLTLANDNPFAFILSGLDYEILVDGAVLDKNVLGANQHIPAGSETQFDWVKEYSFNSNDSPAKKWIDRTSLQYDVKTVARINDFLFPSVARGEMHFPQ